ncbi:MAG: hypothetical protein ABI679_05950 [Gemmatimonadota bacterium]
MDARVLALLIPILALSIPVIALVFSGMTRLARAKKEAIEAQYGGSPNGAVESQLEELRAQMQDVRRDLAETQERLDFTERMLTQQRERQQLPEGKPDTRAGS